MVSKKEIEELLNKKREVYRTDPAQLVADYNTEKATSEGYNGREILELIQNCDDEGAKIVHIHLNEAESTLRISNTGTPFSLRGYRSLSIANLSSKTSKRKYIGNKGLGFRSVLNWSKSIKIFSNDLCVHYSDKSIKEAYSELLSAEEDLKIRREQNFKEGIIPMAMLAIPKVSDWSNTGQFTTEIEIEYDVSFIKDIRKQLNSLTPETLLFLNHLQEIHFKGDAEYANLVASKKVHPKHSPSVFSPSERVKINNDEWSIFQIQNELDSEFLNDKEEKEFYEIKLAVRNTLGDQKSMLYSYFPTNIKLGFPCVIHATFDLDPTRNQLNNSDKNKVVVSELVKLMANTAVYLSKEKCDWRPLSLLTSIREDENEKLHKLEFYSQLHEAVYSEPLFPCIDGEYRAYEDVFNVNFEFADFLSKHDWVEHFPNHVLSGETNLNSKHSIKSYEGDATDSLTNISQEISDIDVRADFIKFCLDYFTNHQIPLLVDAANRIIDTETEVFTPAKDEFQIPEGYHLTTMHRDLFDALVKKLIYDKSQEKARELQRKLKDIVNLFPFDSAELAKKIVAITKAKLDEDEDGLHLIREMVKALYSNYSNTSQKGKSQVEYSVPLMTKSLEIINAKELCFSADYTKGEVAHDLFQDIYNDQKWLASPESFDLQEFEPESVSGFFSWLGVNEFCVYEECKDYGSSQLKDYSKTIYDGEVNEFKYLSIDQIDEILLALSPEQMIIWIYHDSKLRALLKGDHSDSYLGKYQRSFYVSKKSYLSYRIEKSKFNYSTYLLEPSLANLNTVTINYNSELFENYGLKRTHVNEVLLLLGAKEDFSELTIDAVTDILGSLPERFPNGRNVQSIYKKAVDHFDSREEELSKPIQLFARGEHGLKPYPQNQIYFSDKSSIPKRFRSRYPLLNFPLRSGAKKAIDFFQINELESIEFELVNANVQNELNELFQRKLNELKPFLLAHRFSSFKEEKLKKEAAYQLKNIQILLCKDLVVKDGKDTQHLEVYEMLPYHDNSYYIKVMPQDNPQMLYQNSYFMDAFADAICHLFDVREKRAEYRVMLKSDINDIRHDLVNTIGEHELTDALQYLGYASSEDDLLSIYCKHREIDISSAAAKNAKAIIDSFNLPHNYSIGQPTDIDQLKLTVALLQKLDLKLVEYNEVAKNQISLNKLHAVNLKNYFNSKSNSIKLTIWEHLHKQSPLEQAKFLDYYSEFTSHWDFINFWSQNLEYELEIDLHQAFIEFLSQRSTSLKQTLSDISVNIDSEFTENRKHFTAEEVITIDQDKELRSWLYFPDRIRDIKARLDELVIETSKSKESEIHNESLADTQDMSAELANYSTQPPESGKGKRGPYIPTAGTSNADKKRIGNKSEQVVYEYLRMKFGENNVNWDSRMDEGLHYDIKYSSDDWSTTTYVEVKTFSQNSFVLTRHEKEFGELNASDYEIWLVDHELRVFLIKDFFPSHSDDLMVNDYKVRIVIDSTKQIY